MIDTNKNDLSIDGGDIIDIFGSKVAEKEKIKIENTNSSIDVLQRKKAGIESLPEIDEKLITKQETTSAKVDFKKQDNLTELIMFVNEISRILKSELKNFE